MSKKKKLDDLDKELDLFSLQETEDIDLYTEANAEDKMDFIERHEKQLKDMGASDEMIANSKKSIEEQLRLSRERIMRLKDLSNEMRGMDKDDKPTDMPELKGFLLTDVDGREMNTTVDSYYIVKTPTVSSNTIHLVILGEPKAQKRHRSVKMGNFIRQYDPSAKDKDDLLYVVQQQAPKEPFTCPISLSVDFYFTRPKSHYRSGKNSRLLKDTPPLWHLSKPDADNCLKLIQDAMNKVFWRDDSLICDVHITKRYDINPRIEINITPLK